MKIKMLKTLIVFIPLFICQTLFAQSSDAYISATYQGYVGGKHIVAVTNKLSCTADIQFRFNGFTPSSVTPNPNNNVLYNQVAGGATTLYYFTGASSGTIDVKALTVCSWQGYLPGWLTPAPLTSLPVDFESVSYKVDDKSKKLITLSFKVAREMNVKEYWVDLGTDFGELKGVMLVFPQKVLTPGTYTAKLNLNNYIKK